MNVSVLGNIEPVLKSDEPLSINFNSFRENRLHFLARLKDQKGDPSGQVIFTPLTSGSSLPSCILNVALPEMDQEPRPAKRTTDGVTPGLELRNARLFPKIPGMCKMVIFHNRN